MMKNRRCFSLVERREIVEKSQACLWNADGQIGRDYLLNVRKLSEGMIREFGLGFIPSFVKHQLCGRIIFPIFNPSGKLVVVASRLVDGKSTLPVYWHESYEKDFYLYGANLAKEHILSKRFAIVVEGQFDVLRMHDSGLRNTVGLCGTKFSDYHLAVIMRYCDEIIVLLDTDANMAGQKASKKIIKRAVSAVAVGDRHYFVSDYRRKIGILNFDENLDPDEAIDKHGARYVEQLIENKLQELRSGC